MPLLSIYTVLLLLSLPSSTSAFVAAAHNNVYNNVMTWGVLPSSTQSSITHNTPPTSNTALDMVTSGIFDNIGDFSKDDGNKNMFAKTDKKNSEEFPGSTVIFRVEAESMKVGGLRLWIFLHMMGQLNTPIKNTWKANQKDGNVLEMYYRDTTGAIVITFVEDVGVVVYRFGASPSMEYMMRESFVLLGVLDELEKIVSDGEIPEDDRLLVLKEPYAIQNARESLPYA